MPSQPQYDAVVVGSGPNGLAAAITLQRQGLRVLLLEAKGTIGGGLRTAELTLPGFLHDRCAAIHPLGAASPFFRELPLHKFGLEFIHPDVLAAHPFDDGSSGALYSSLGETASRLGADGHAYRSLLEPLVDEWPAVERHLLGPLFQWPRHPLTLARFGLRFMQSGKQIAARFRQQAARGLWAGMVAHSMLPLEARTTAAIGLVLAIAGHRSGWPVVRGGSQGVADALGAYFVSLGGEIRTNTPIGRLADLPPSRAVLFDVTPRQLLAICGDHLSGLYRWQLRRHRYGMGVFKIDWALSEPPPFSAHEARLAGTVHLGGTFEEIAASERQAWRGEVPKRPFVLFAQQSIVDGSRAPAGKHTGWAYCHVPHGSDVDMSEPITAQVERFAPGFRDTILATHTQNAVAMEAYNPNYVGGDINGGVINLAQLVNRPALRFSPYRTSAKGIYICSASAPPGGGVHGMAGYHAAVQALRDLF